MKTIPTTEQREFAATLRALLAAENPVDLVRAIHEPGADRGTPALWKALADAGVFGLAVAEEYGGAGGSLDDLAVFYTEAGRALCPTTVHSSILAALAVDQLGSPDDKACWLPPVAAGSIRATTALSNARDAALLAPTLHADRAGERWRLNGTADFVLDADVADLIVVSASADERALAFVADVRDLSIEPLDMAGGVRAFTMRFDNVNGAVLDGATAPALRRLANTAVALGSLDLVGVGGAVLDRTVDYTKLRHQFGRPIASFQAAQHLVANMHIALSAARLAAHAAVCLLGRGGVASRQTAIARMHAATAARLITLDAHQLHGGMGYVTETDVHLWSERARFGSTFGGGADVAAGWLQQSMYDDEQERP